MSRPRLTNRGLPARVYPVNGRYYYIERLNEDAANRKPRQRRHRLTRVSDGEAAMYDALAALLRKLNNQRRTGSMVALIDAWKADEKHGLGKYATKTRVEYLRMAGIIQTAFEEFDADQVEPRHCAAFIDENYSATPNAANKYKAVLSLVFAHGVRKGYRNDNPTRELRNYDDEGGRSRYITDDELARLRAAALVGEDGMRTRSGPMMVCLFDLAAITGQRIGDLLALKWSQVSIEGILFEPAKTRSSSGVRVPVAMTQQLKAVLERARTMGDVKSLYVIHTLDGRPYAYHGAQSAWRRACARARATYEKECSKRGQQAVAAFLTDMHFHDLKHRALTDAKRQGRDAQKLGGHTTAKMTAQYIEEVEVEWVQPPVNSVIGG